MTSAPSCASYSTSCGLLKPNVTLMTFPVGGRSSAHSLSMHLPHPPEPREAFAAKLSGASIAPWPTAHSLTVAGSHPRVVRPRVGL